MRVLPTCIGCLIWVLPGCSGDSDGPVRPEPPQADLCRETGDSIPIGTRLVRVPGIDLPDDVPLGKLREAIADKRSTFLNAAFRTPPDDGVWCLPYLPYIGLSPSHLDALTPETVAAIEVAGPYETVRATAGAAEPSGDGRIDAYKLPIGLQNVTTTGEGYTVAVIDSGVDAGHEFLLGALAGSACFTDGQCEADTLGNANSCTSTGHTGCAECVDNPRECDHGTAMAGIIGGRNADTRPAQGVASGVMLHPIRVLTRDNATGPSGSSGDVVRALQYLVQRIDEKSFPAPLAAVNLSLTYDAGDQAGCEDHWPATRDAIHQLHSRGVLVVAAAGNRGYSDRTAAPACLDEAVAVSAADRGYTGRPQWANGSDATDILAPGTGVVVATRAPIYAPDGTATARSYGRANGSSAAAAAVSGAVAVLRQAHGVENPGGATVKGWLMGQTKPGNDWEASQSGSSNPADTRRMLYFSGPAAISEDLPPPTETP